MFGKECCVFEVRNTFYNRTGTQKKGSLGRYLKGSNQVALRGLSSLRNEFPATIPLQRYNFLALRKHLQDFFVSGEPFDSVDVLFGEPAGGFVLVKVEGVAGQGAEVAVQGKVEFGIVVVHSVQKFLYYDVRGEFFADLANKSLLWRFAGFYLSAREFPPILELAIAALGREYLTILADDSCHYFYPFHHNCKDSILVEE